MWEESFPLKVGNRTIRGKRLGSDGDDSGVTEENLSYLGLVLTEEDKRNQEF